MEWWALSSALVGISYYAFFQAAELMNQISFPLIAVIAGLIGGTMMAQENEKAK
jgi:ribose/xylose/arabinose/galactoside ABC-type transport system permease subunit